MRLLCSLVPVSLVVSSCGTLPDGSRWGENATLLPDLKRVGRAALQAAIEPMTWAPAVGAAVFTIDHWDRKVSDWASDRTPIFGSQASAQDWSDRLNYIGAAFTAGTALATPSGGEAGPWLLDKTKGLSVEVGAVLVGQGVAEGLKRAIERDRPNGEGDQSFPSGHSTFAFSLATLSSRNVEALSLPRPAEIGLQAGFYTLAGFDAWARVEAKKHFPSDVLAGAAIGHFTGAFIHDAFLGLPQDRGPFFSVGPTFHGGPDGGMFEVSFPF
jgi:PAP2 superfamily